MLPDDIPNKMPAFFNLCMRLSVQAQSLRLETWVRARPSCRQSFGGGNQQRVFCDALPQYSTTRAENRLFSLVIQIIFNGGMGTTGRSQTTLSHARIRRNTRCRRLINKASQYRERTEHPKSAGNRRNAQLHLAQKK